MAPSSLTNQPDEIRALVTSLLAAWNAHDAEQVIAHYAPSYRGLDVGRAKPAHGIEAVREAFVAYCEAFPDLCLVVEEMIVQENQVAVHWVAHGTHRGPLLKIPPSGHRVDVRGISLLTVEDGQVVAGIHVWDVAGLLRSIGLLPLL